MVSMTLLGVGPPHSCRAPRNTRWVGVADVPDEDIGLTFGANSGYLWQAVTGSSRPFYQESRRVVQGGNSGSNSPASRDGELGNCLLAVAGLPPLTGQSGSRPLR